MQANATAGVLIALLALGAGTVFKVAGFEESSPNVSEKAQKSDQIGESAVATREQNSDGEKARLAQQSRIRSSDKDSAEKVQNLAEAVGDLAKEAIEKRGHAKASHAMHPEKPATSNAAANGQVRLPPQFSVTPKAASLLNGRPATLGMPSRHLPATPKPRMIRFRGRFLRM